MISNREIGYIGKRNRPKSYKYVLRYAYGKEWGNKTRKYYFFTPKSRDLYKELNEKIEFLTNKENLLKIIDEICICVQALEIIAKLQFQEFFNNNVINEHFKAQRRKFNEKEIKKKQDKLSKAIQEFPKSLSFELKMPPNSILKIKDKSYIKVKDNFVELKFEDFFNIISKYMTNMMSWIAYKDEKNREFFSDFFLKKMFDLFVEIEKESQMKI